MSNKLLDHIRKWLDARVTRVSVHAEFKMPAEIEYSSTGGSITWTEQSRLLSQDELEEQAHKNLRKWEKRLRQSLEKRSQRVLQELVDQKSEGIKKKYEDRFKEIKEKYVKLKQENKKLKDKLKEDADAQETE
jgi:hypothetical protein